MGQKIKVVKDKMQRQSDSSDSSEKIKKEEREQMGILESVICVQNV